MIKVEEYIKNKDKYEVIDVRASENILANGKIEEACEIFKGELSANYMNHLNKDTHYVIYCGSGNSAGLIEKLLKSNGYKADSLEGGYAGFLEYQKNNK